MTLIAFLLLIPHEVFSQQTGPGVKTMDSIVTPKENGMLIYYAPFYIDWSFAMTTKRISEASSGSVRLKIGEDDWKYILQVIKSNKISGVFNSARVGLLVKDRTGSSISILDANGGVHMDGEEFAIKPNALVRIFVRLDRLKREQEESKESVDSKDIVMRPPFQEIIIPDEATARKIVKIVLYRLYGDAAILNYNHAQVTLHGTVWRVLVPTSNKKQILTKKNTPFWVEISKSDGRIIDFRRSISNARQNR